MIRHVLAGLVSTIGIALVACSGDDASASISAEAACDDAVKAYCKKIDECAPFFVKIGFGDAATCEKRFALNCVQNFSAPGTSATPSRLSQCATDVKTTTCEEVLGRKLPLSCRTEAGSLKDGTPCGDDAQCTGKLCRQANDSNVCGACSSIGAGGAACERDEDCDNELGCADKKCVAFGKAGSPCSATQPCIRTLSCNKGTCAQPLAAGAACDGPADQSTNPCEALKGFFCHPQTKVCTAAGMAAAGAACGFIDKNIVLCTGGGHCKTTPPAVSGTCLAPAADGAACDATNGPKCVAPAQCLGGICKVSDPATCK
jgi:hypothetical protein